MALSHKFLGVISSDNNHFAQMFMSQRLCSLDLISEYYYTMQNLYYKIPGHLNTAYLRHYIASMPGKILELVHQSLLAQDISIDTLSLATLHHHILTILKNECASYKIKKNVKKQLHFSPVICDSFSRHIILDVIRTPPRRVLKETKLINVNVKPSNIPLDQRKNTHLERKDLDSYLEGGINQPSKQNVLSVVSLVIGKTIVPIKKRKRFKRKFLLYLKLHMIKQNGILFLNLILILNAFLLLRQTVPQIWMKISDNSV